MARLVACIRQINAKRVAHVDVYTGEKKKRKKRERKEKNPVAGRHIETGGLEEKEKRGGSERGGWIENESHATAEIRTIGASA